MFEDMPRDGCDPPGWQPTVRTAARSFREYVVLRRYDFGRSRPESWAFIAFARGDPDLVDVQSWAELRHYLETAEAPPDIVSGARSVWRSFTAYRSLLHQDRRAAR